jgi:hypothetical protein
MMENETVSVEEKFYQDVADLLGVESNYEHNVNKAWRTRWNNRKPGNGRFEGFGLIRFFGENMIHVMISKPVHMNKTFSSPEETLSALKKALDESRLPL